MKYQEIIIDGNKDTIVLEIPNEMYDEYEELEDTIELNDVVNEILGEKYE